MARFYIPTKDAEEWRRFLAKPEKHWQTGYSAKTLAYCWEEAKNFPPEIVSVFSDSGFEAFRDIEFLVGFPDYQVPLPGGSTSSQSEIFILAKAQGRLISITVQGKESEPFGPSISEWAKINSRGKKFV